MGSTSFTNKVVGIFSDSVSVNAALDDLNANGFDRSDISVLAKDYDESERVITHSTATAYPDTELRNDVYRSGVTGSDIYPTGTMDSTLRGEVAGRTSVDRDILLDTQRAGYVDAAYTDINRDVVVESDRNLVTETQYDETHDVAEKDPKAMVKGATAGGALGLIAGLGVLLIPGIGPVLAAGPLAAAITAAAGGAAIGATAGTLVGILNDEGIPSDRADFYNRHFSKGNVIVMIHTDEGHSARAREILVKHNPETIDTF